MKLSERLQYISSQVPLAANVIDVAADHSYVAIELAKQNAQRRVIASDIAAKPLAAGRQNAQKYGLTNIEFRLGDGLSVLKPQDDIDTAIISGIGGTLMCKLLEAQSTDAIKRYILQPNNASALVRAWLQAHGYELIADERISERGQLYEAIVAEKKAKAAILYAADGDTRTAEFYFGPNIARQYETNYKRWLIAKIKQLNKQKMQMTKSMDPFVRQDMIKCDKLVAYGASRLSQLKEDEES